MTAGASVLHTVAVAAGLMALVGLIALGAWLARCKGEQTD